jgi:hypothetical protein
VIDWCAGYQSNTHQIPCNEESFTGARINIEEWPKNDQKMVEKIGFCSESKKLILRKKYCV